MNFAVDGERFCCLPPTKATRSFPCEFSSSFRLFLGFFCGGFSPKDFEDSRTRLVPFDSIISTVMPDFYCIFFSRIGIAGFYCGFNGFYLCSFLFFSDCDAACYAFLPSLLVFMEFFLLSVRNFMVCCCSDSLLPAFTGFCQVLLGFTRFYWILPDLTTGFTGFYRVLLGFTGFFLVLLGFAGFCWFLLGFG